MKLVGILLAGGKGTRLGALTRKNAKPAVPFGGKYRIIDFVLSNCVNSKIDVVGVVTQYESIALNQYIASGTRYGYDGQYAKTVILPPRQKSDTASFFNGTGDAVYQNFDFIDDTEAEYVIILSADHIYQMDYQKMFEFHLAKKADLTIACIEVPLSEASRFGILVTNEDDRVTTFEEKPKNPSSTKASMGIYIFTTAILKKYLTRQAKLEGESDFGKNIIPEMLKDKAKIYSYIFDGYWRDVGTIDSLFEANMDCIENPTLLNNKIYSEDTHSFPQLLGSSALVTSSLINQGCIIHGEIVHSVLFSNCYISHGVRIKDCILLPNVKVGHNVILENVIVLENTVIPDNFELISPDKVVTYGK